MLARARFYLIFFNCPPKMVPKWTQMGTNIAPKTASCQKSGFSLSYSKTNDFGRKSGVRGFDFRDPRRLKINENTEFDVDVDF